jgi:site-specific recombinase XerD
MRSTTENLVEVSVLSDGETQIREQGWLEAFASHLREGGRSERTIRAYCQDVRSFASWFEGVNGVALSPELITGVDLRAYRAFAIANMAPATFNRRRAMMAVLIEWAMGVGYLNYDPLRGVKPFKQEESPPRWLDEQEYHRLTRTVERMVNAPRPNTEANRRMALRDAAMVALMLWAGLREGEVCQLDLADVKIGERVGRVVVRNGKGNKRREIPLNNEARLAIGEWCSVRGGDQGALFSGKRGERITPKCVQDRTRVIRIAAGLDEEVTPHALRHTFAKRMVDRGESIGVVQKLLGHARLETTLAYTKPGWKDLERAVEG